MAELLKADGLAQVFGGLRAVSNFNMVIEKGELIGLIGPNGAGKTTAFNMITGVYRPTEGELTFNGKSIVGKKPSEITARGIARTFQNIRLFSELSVLENVKIAYHTRTKYTVAEAVLRLGRYFKEEREIEEKAKKLLAIFRLEKQAHELAKNLPYGAQRRLEIARALAAKPKLLLLDEPAAGMNPNETAELMETIQLVQKRFHMTILLIEHDMKLVSGICERLTVLNFGKVLKQGETQEVLHDPEVVKAYLGE